MRWIAKHITTKRASRGLIRGMLSVEGIGRSVSPLYKSKKSLMDDNRMSWDPHISIIWVQHIVGSYLLMFLLSPQSSFASRMSDSEHRVVYIAPDGLSMFVFHLAH
jgi:hypothetical protein